LASNAPISLGFISTSLINQFVQFNHQTSGILEQRLAVILLV
jgi:hypothetical protein